MAGSKPYNWRQRKPIKNRKLCKARGCYYPAFSHEYCKRHQYFWAAKLPIPKFKKKKPSRTQGFGFSSQMEVFQSVIYSAPRPIICPVSGKNITNVFREDPSVWVNNCAHILNKGKWPLFKLNPGNIILIDKEAHRLYDQGTEVQRIATGWNFNVLYELRDKLKIEYDNYLKYGQTETPNDQIELPPENEAGTSTG